MKRTSLHSVSRAGLALAFVCLSAPAAKAETAADIVAASIAASGGAAIARIESFSSTGTLAIEVPGLGTIDGTIEQVRVPGRGYYENVHIGPIYQQQGWDGEQSWRRGPAGREVLEGYEAASLALQSFPNTLVGLQRLAPDGLSIEQLDDAELDGRPQHVLEVSTAGGAPTRLYVDRDTKLVTRSVTRPNPDEPQIIVEIVDYEAYEGVMMPTSVTITVEGTSNTRLKLDSTVVNTAVDESVFAMPGN